MSMSIMVLALYTKCNLCDYVFQILLITTDYGFVIMNKMPNNVRLFINVQ